jgi:cytochrome P450
VLFTLNVRAGELIIALLGGANRDPAVFTNPQRFDVTRADAGKHLAFSAGIHYCIGAALAKMEGEVALRALFDRFPDLTLTMEPHRRPSPSSAATTPCPPPSTRSESRHDRGMTAHRLRVPAAPPEHP